LLWSFPFQTQSLPLCYSPHLTHTLGVVFTFVLFSNTKAKNALVALLHTFLVLDLNHICNYFVSFSFCHLTSFTIMQGTQASFVKCTHQNSHKLTWIAQKESLHTFQCTRKLFMRWVFAQRKTQDLGWN
jgi:hypothetical protein